jgi:hypothetical protein
VSDSHRSQFLFHVLSNYSKIAPQRSLRQKLIAVPLNRWRLAVVGTNPPANVLGVDIVISLHEKGKKKATLSVATNGRRLIMKSTLLSMGYAVTNGCAEQRPPGFDQVDQPCQEIRSQGAAFICKLL